MLKCILNQYKNWNQTVISYLVHPGILLQYLFTLPLWSYVSDADEIPDPVIYCMI